MNGYAADWAPYQDLQNALSAAVDSQLSQQYANVLMQTFNTRKREALENVLVPYRVDENVELLKRCGFTTVDTCFRWLNWAAFVAIKQQT